MSSATTEAVVRFTVTETEFEALAKIVDDAMWDIVDKPRTPEQVKLHDRVCGILGLTGYSKPVDPEESLPKPGDLNISGPSMPTADTPEGGDYALMDGGTNVLAEVFHRVAIDRTQDAKALATLFAASPRLLRVARLLVHWLDEEPGAHKLCDEAREAIMDATGSPA